MLNFNPIHIGQCDGCVGPISDSFSNCPFQGDFSTFHRDGGCKIILTWYRIGCIMCHHEGAHGPFKFCIWEKFWVNTRHETEGKYWLKLKTEIGVARKLTLKLICNLIKDIWCGTHRKGICQNKCAFWSFGFPCRKWFAILLVHFWPKRQLSCTSDLKRVCICTQGYFLKVPTWFVFQE